MRSRVKIGALLCLLGTLGLGGCEPAPLDKPAPTPPSELPATLHFVQGAVALPKIDVVIDKQVYATLDFRQSKGGISLPAGAHEILLRPSGSTGTPLFTSGLTVAQGQRLLLLSRWQRSESGVRAVTVQSEPLGLADAAGVRVRLLHASEGTPTVDLYDGGNKPLAEAVEAGKASAYATLGGDVAAMTPLGVREHGTPFDLWRVLVPATVAKGTVLTALALGDADPMAADSGRFRISVLSEDKGTLTDLPTEPSTEGPRASLSFLHVSPDAPAVDVVAPSGAKLAQNLSYQRASMLTELAGGVYKLTVQETTGGTIRLEATVRLIPGARLLLALHGLVGSGAGSPTPLGFLALPRAAMGEAWRVAHLVPGAPAFDVTLDNKVVSKGLVYPGALPQRLEALPAGTLRFLTGDTKVPGWQSTVDAATAMQVAGELVTVLIAGSLTNGLKPPTALLVVESQATTMAPPPVRLLPTTLPTM